MVEPFKKDIMFWLLIAAVIIFVCMFGIYAEHTNFSEPEIVEDSDWYIAEWSGNWIPPEPQDETTLDVSILEPGTCVYIRVCAEEP